LCSFLHSPVTSSLFGPNILLSTLFSNTLSLRQSLNVSDQASHPYTATDKIILLCILIVILSVANWKTNFFYRMMASILWLQSALNFFPDKILIVWFVPNYLNCSALAKELLSVLTLWLLHALWSRDMTTHLVTSPFTYRPVSIAAVAKINVFFLYSITLPPTTLLSAEADVYHVIWSCPGLPEPCYWHTLKQSWKVMAIKNLLVSNHSW
jgi:hypothetical protein